MSRWGWLHEFRRDSDQRETFHTFPGEEKHCSCTAGWPLVTASHSTRDADLCGETAAACALHTRTERSAGEQLRTYNKCLHNHPVKGYAWLTVSIPSHLLGVWGVFDLYRWMKSSQSCVWGSVPTHEWGTSMCGECQVARGGGSASLYSYSGIQVSLWQTNIGMKWKHA